jgi:hypothetical protein
MKNHLNKEYLKEVIIELKYPKWNSKI